MKQKKPKILLLIDPLVTPPSYSETGFAFCTGFTGDSFSTGALRTARSKRDKGGGGSMKNTGVKVIQNWKIYGDNKNNKKQNPKTNSIYTPTPHPQYGVFHLPFQRCRPRMILKNCQEYAGRGGGVKLENLSTKKPKTNSVG